jgi:hypothetical protein
MMTMFEKLGASQGRRLTGSIRVRAKPAQSSKPFIQSAGNLPPLQRKPRWQYGDDLVGFGVKARVPDAGPAGELEESVIH